MLRKHHDRMANQPGWFEEERTAGQYGPGDLPSGRQRDRCDVRTPVSRAGSEVERT